MKNLYVGNLSWDATEDDVKDYFGQIGTVKSAKIITDRDSGKSRGFCFVEMDNADQAIEELNGQEMMGRKLTINEARPRAQSPRESYHSAGGDSYRERTYRR